MIGRARDLASTSSAIGVRHPARIRFEGICGVSSTARQSLPPNCIVTGRGQGTSRSTSGFNQANATAAIPIGLAIPGSAISWHMQRAHVLEVQPDTGF